MHLHGWCFQTAGGIQQEVGLPCAVLGVDAVARFCGFNSGAFGVAKYIKMRWITWQHIVAVVPL